MKAPFLSLLLLGVAGSAAIADPPGRLFDNNCAICHQRGGKGVPGQFPRLAGRVGTIATSPRGREFLTTLLLNGMNGSVQVDGQKIVGIMPDFSAFSDDDLAAILNYVASLDGGKAHAFTAADLKAERVKPPVAPAEVEALRNKLQATKVIP